MTALDSSSVWRPEPRARDVFRRAQPHLVGDPITHALCRLIMLVARRYVLEVRGLEHVSTDKDPFVFVLNHSQRPEAVLVPTLLIYMRGGRRVHFLSDWNFQLIPGLGLIFRRAGVITLTQKPARPRFLNVFKRFFEHEKSGSERAIDALREGRSVGVFPEGTINRDPLRMLRGRHGAAQISLSAQVPVVPAGIRFPLTPKDRPISDRDRFEVEIGPPIEPPRDLSVAGGSRDEVRAWHDRLMREVARLSGKTWDSAGRR